MSKFSLTVVVVAALCAGCRSNPPPVLPHTRADCTPQPEPQAVLNSTTTQFPAGAWARPLADGTSVDLDLDPDHIRFVLHLKDNANLTMQGACSVTGDGKLSGVMATVQLEGPGLSFTSELSAPFVLHFVNDGDRLTVTDYQGGGWDAQGQESMRGCYVRSERSTARQARPVAPKRYQPPEPVVTGRPGEDLTVTSRPYPDVQSTYRERGDDRQIEVAFPLWKSR